MERVSFGDAGIPGYECGEKSAPGVIVLQEWWGVTENIKKQALFISSKGYRCLVPDLYKGKLGVNVEEAHHLMSNLDWPGAKGARGIYAYNLVLHALLLFSICWPHARGLKKKKQPINQITRNHSVR